jgi:hypothetical protein
VTKHSTWQKEATISSVCGFTIAPTIYSVTTGAIFTAAINHVNSVGSDLHLTYNMVQRSSAI